MRNPREFGERLSKAVHHPEAYKILGPMIAPKPNDWMNGGCCVLAKALYQWFGTGELWMVIRNGEIVHVVLKIGNCYFDAEGCHSKTGIIRDWKESWGHDIKLRPYNEAAAIREGLSCPDPRPIVQYLDRAMRR
jgi:hypothetical protein